MLNSAIPTKMAVPFANSGEKQTIPVASQIGISSGRASFTDGFPPLTRTPLTAGGIPPYGTDFNGILNAITSSIRWSNAGGVYSFDSDFSSSVGGYPKGSLLSNSINSGYWFNTTDGNTANPENTNASLTGWVLAFTYGTTDVTGLAAANVTLTALQAANERITLAGVLTANINLIFPAWSKSWTIVNNCTGAFSVTCKTPSGTGVATATGATIRIIGDGTNIISNESTLVSGALQKSANLSDLANVATARANLGVSPHGFSRFTSNGSFTVPAGVTQIFVSGCAAGGGGGSSLATNSSSFVTGGSGGGAGQPALNVPITVTPGQVIPITIGTGGTGATAATNNATAGGNTQLGTGGVLLNLAGGSPGQVGGGGTAYPSNFGGPGGGAGYPIGGSAQDTNSFTATTATGGMGGQGASGPFGQAGPAGRGARGNNSPAGNGFGYGAGGSGAGGAYTSATSVPGGAGSSGLDGYLVIEW
ncbi:hypothetical protein LH413_13990 [Yersinia massiliensis]|uniref:glycine-rich domain-containing protein n=1 Tax=Yersinia massiliensis TaxID=419257 RepID=UPI001CFC47C6|nr:hypothetical protein [Yersinia massiliensis]MCB5318603.1 hypothetical protein [Yersinia massiliensis]